MHRQQGVRASGDMGTFFYLKKVVPREFPSELKNTENRHKILFGSDQDSVCQYFIHDQSIIVMATKVVQEWIFVVISACSCHSNPIQGVGLQIYPETQTNCSQSYEPECSENRFWAKLTHKISTVHLALESFWGCCLLIISQRPDPGEAETCRAKADERFLLCYHKSSDHVWHHTWKFVNKCFASWIILSHVFI